MIYIARNFKGKIVGIVSAKTEDSVKAYYQGKGLVYNTLEPFNLSEDRENEKMGFVTPILETSILKGYEITNPSAEILIVK